MSIYRNTLHSLALIGAASVFSSGIAWAQTATDLICSGCVGTNDLANNSVGNLKLKDNSVGQNKIKDKSVGQNKIKDRSVGALKLKLNAVQSANIRDGAVTFSKLAEDAVFMRIKVVSPIGPSAQDNCNELLAALNGITDSSFTNPYLIVLEPGIYDCGLSSVDMMEFVNIRGSGPNTTRISGTVDGSSGSGVVNGANNAQLSSLTVENDGGGVSAIAIAISNVNASPDLFDLEVRAFNAVDQAIAINNSGSDPDIIRVDALAIASAAGTLAVGILNDSSSPNISASQAEASADPVTGTGTELVGMLNLNGSSPELEQTTSHAEGRLVAASAFGMRNESASSPTIVWGSTEAEEAAGTNIGMDNRQGSSALMALGAAQGEGGNLAVGIRNAASDVTLFTVLVGASGATSNEGMQNTTAPITVTAHNAFFSGADHSIDNNNAGNTNNLAATQLDGPATTTTGTWNCAYAYDGAFVPLNASCE